MTGAGGPAPGPTITASYAATARDHPDRVAVLDRSGAVRYPEFEALVARAAGVLREHGERLTLGLLLPNGRAFLVWFAAAARAGWRAVPLDPRWTTAELADRVSLVHPDLVVVEPGWRHRFAGVATALRGPEVPSTGDAVPGDAGGDLAARPLYVGFTSGSTGRPKAFERDQGSWLRSFAVNAGWFGWRARDRVLVPGPLSGAHFGYAAVAALWLGATAVVPPAFTPAGVVRGVRRGHCAHVAVVPTMLESLVEHGAGDPGVVHWYCTGAKCPPGTEDAVRRLFPRSVVDEFYGASELSFVTARRTGDGLPAGSVGRPLPGVAVRIVDRLGRPRPVGARGFVQVASPWLFSHYLTGTGTDPGRRDGRWLGIGDVGRLEAVPGEAPCLVLEGRRDGMIVTGGQNVFPEEIEAVLRALPGVGAVVVVGLEDRHWGEVVCAVVQPAPGAAPDPAALQRMCRARLSTPKVPRLWRVVPRLPLTAGGKPDRRALRRLLASPDAVPHVRWTRRAR